VDDIFQYVNSDTINCF